MRTISTGNARDELIAILQETRNLVARPGNDFSWSSWQGSADALAEMDAQIAMVTAGDRSKRLNLSVLFAPTGPLQELSLSSGWSDEYIALASRFDRVESA